jgi:hypothetical protein
LEEKIPILGKGKEEEGEERRELVVGKGMEECEYGFFHLNGNNIFL